MWARKKSNNDRNLSLPLSLVIYLFYSFGLGSGWCWGFLGLEEEDWSTRIERSGVASGDGLTFNKLNLRM